MQNATMTLIVLAALFPAPADAETAKFGETTRKGEYEAYISRDGTHYKLGDKLKIGVPQGGSEAFTNVLQNFGALNGSQPCSTRCIGLEYEIVSFRAAGKGQAFRMWAKLEESTAPVSSVIVSFDAALESGELIGRGYTSDQALTELKKWKDKLDLELITPEEYEAKKKELAPYIH